MANERIQQRIQRLLDEADEAVSQFDWETVQNSSRAVLAFDPDNSEALAFLTAAERALGGIAASTDAATRTESSEPVPTLPLTRLQLAELLLEHYPDERPDAMQHRGS